MTLELPTLAEGTTRLILVRHGEPDRAVQGRCYGQLDPPLSRRGREQMRQTWLLLADQSVEAVYSSPSRRAMESVKLRVTSTAPAAIDNRLREIDFGSFEGLTYAEISQRYPEKYQEWMTRPTEVVFPGGESFAVMSARVRAGLDDIRHAHSGKTVVTVSHGGVNRVALAQALDLDPHHIFRLAQAYGCVNVIDYLGDEAVVRVMNVTVHQC